MTLTGVIGPDRAPTGTARLMDWVRDVAALTEPAAVIWCDGSEAERDRLTRKLIEAGTVVPPDHGPGGYRCVPDTEDVAQLGRHTYVCTRDEAAVDPAVHWMEPVDMKIILTEEYRGCMTGRTMYVVPFRVRGGAGPVVGVQITDSEFVVVSMHLMSDDATLGPAALGDDTEFVRCLHSVGAPRRPGQADVPWPCDHTKYTARFPESRTIWSYGSGFADNALLTGDVPGVGVSATAPDSPATMARARRAEIDLIESWLEGATSR